MAQQWAAEPLIIIIIQRTERQIPLGVPNCRWEANNKINFKGINIRLLIGLNWLSRKLNVEFFE
jgi:hypothetical protein